MITENKINRIGNGRLTINFDKGMKRNTESAMTCKKDAHTFIHDVDNIVSIYYAGKQVSIKDIESWKR